MIKSKFAYFLAFSLVFLLSTASSFSQLNMSLQGGINSTNMLSQYNGEEFNEEDSDPSYFKTGYNFSILLSNEIIDFSSHLKGVVYGGLSVENKGFAYDYYKNYYRWGQYEGREKLGQKVLTIDYFSIPAYLQTRYCLNDSYFFTNLGVYVSHVLDAKMKAIGDYKKSLKEQGENTTSDVTYDYHSDALIKPFDSGLIFGLGAGYKQFSTSLNMQLGLLNLIPEEPTDYKVRNFALSLWICYQINQS